MHFFDLGVLRVEVEGAPVLPGGRAPSAVLSTLLLHLDRRVEVDLLIDAVWGDAASERAIETLGTHVWRLRKLLEPRRKRGDPASVIVSESGGYRLAVAAADVSSARFAQLARAVTDLLTSGQAERALRAADDALELWEGPPFVHVADRIWATGAIARLEEEHLQVQERRIDALLAVGDTGRALSEGRELVEAHPLRERLWAQQMLAAYRAHRTDDALRTFARAREVLVEETGLEPGAELVALHQRILRQDEALAAPSSAVTTPRPVEIRLPRRRQLIGREQQAETLGKRIADNPLVTVVGSAGCGKTALAVEVARGIADGFADGVWFVDLRTATDGTDVVAEVLHALGQTVEPTTTGRAALSGFARDNQALVILDNCEQIVDQAAEVCAILAEPGRDLRVLATSREALGLEGEDVHRLTPLPTTAREGDAEPSPAARLFLTRDHRGRAMADLDRRDRDALARICRAVDGLPLALELAAGWTESYSIDEIADQVEADPSGLASVGSRHGRHHRTLHAAVERSYLLLEPDEQALFRRLSVLPGTFSPELAAAVAADAIDRRDMAGLLARLAHRSLLTVHPGERTRFSQLAAVRSHASHALARAGESDAALAFRDAWTVGLVRRRTSFGRAEEAPWYADLTADLAVVRATLHDHLEIAPDALGAEVACGLLDHWYYQGLTREGLHWTRLAVDRVPEEDYDHRLSLLALTCLYAFEAQADPARATLERAVDQIREPADPTPEVALGLVRAAAALSLTYDHEAMCRALDVAKPVVDRAADPDLAVAWDTISCMADAMGGGPTDIAVRAQECFERAQSQGNLWAAWLSCSILTYSALATRNAEFGLPWARRLVSLQGRLGARSVPQQYESFADLLVMRGDLEHAVRVFSASYHAARRSGAQWPRNPTTAEMLQTAQRDLPKAGFDAAWAHGRTLRREELLETG